jgi:acyl-coenzyme A synthetase/AMP-(fatty) acid ligase
MFQKGDRIAIDMPMTCDAVIIYLAIILGGFVVVSIADSFAPQEISSRMGISRAVAIFTQVRHRTSFFMVHPFFSVIVGLF